MKWSSSRFLLSCCVLFMGCGDAAARNQAEAEGAKKDEDTRAAIVQDVTQPLIRVANRSDIDFDSVVVSTPDQVQRYGPVSRDSVSEYRAFSHAYEYAHVEVFAGEKSYLLEPIDYVGETPLKPGRYTYELHISGDRLSLVFRVD